MAETIKIPDDPSSSWDNIKTVPGKRGDARGGAAGREVAAPLPESSRIGRFVVLRKLGEGGMGVVYAAYDEELDRKVAVKLLHARKDSSEARARLAREAQAMARLSHPNVVAIYEVGEFSGQVFVAMEFVHGRTLRAFVREGKASLREIILMFLQAGRGLAAAHRAGLVHRDFKPDNVIVGDDGRARVLDFGLARFIGEREEASPGAAYESPPAPHDGSALVTPITQDGTVMGTPAFMAPEQLAGKTVTEHSDQFSFCVALYAALYGEHPFGGENVGEMILNIVSSAIRPAPEGTPVPQWIRGALVRGMANNPAERWPSMEHLIGEVERGLEEDPELNLSSVKRQRFLVMAGLVSVSVAVSIYIALFGRFEMPTPKIAFTVGAASSAIYLAVVFFARRALFSPPHRKLTFALLISIVLLMVHRSLSVLFDQPVPQILSEDLLLLGATISVAAATVDKMLWSMPGIFVLSAAAIPFYPARAGEIFGVATTVAFVVLLALFRHRGKA